MMKVRNNTRKRAQTPFFRHLEKGKRGVFQSTSKIAYWNFRTVQHTPMLDQNISITTYNGGATETFYYNQDERQSVRNLTSESQHIVQGYDYTASGDPIDAPGFKVIADV